MPNLNKKAISNVLAAVLLVPLSIIALVFLAVVTTNSIQDSFLSPKFSCPQIQIKNPILTQDVCYNISTQDVELKIKRGFNIYIDSLDFVINTGTQSSRWHCSTSCPDCGVQDEGETKTYYFHIGSFNNNEENTIHVLTESCLLDTKDIVEC